MSDSQSTQEQSTTAQNQSELNEFISRGKKVIFPLTVLVQLTNRGINIEISIIIDVKGAMISGDLVSLQEYHIECIIKREVYSLPEEYHRKLYTTFITAYLCLSMNLVYLHQFSAFSGGNFGFIVQSGGIGPVSGHSGGTGPSSSSSSLDNT